MHFCHAFFSLLSLPITAICSVAREGLSLNIGSDAMPPVAPRPPPLQPLVRVEPLLLGDLTQAPLYHRKAILGAIVEPLPRFVEVLHCERVNASVPGCNSAKGRLAVVIDRFEASITNNEEGIMVKRADAKYEPGIREYDCSSEV